MKSLEICLLKQKCRARGIEFIEYYDGQVRVNKINFDNYEDAEGYLKSIPLNSATALAMTEFVNRKSRKTYADAKMQAEARVLLKLIDNRASPALNKMRPILRDIAGGDNLSASCITPSDFLRSVRRQLQPGF